ncbi:hypothetical protein J4G37_18820 [Microvirga sp. 3-52]|nr:hypothetical protein [Microvirga sp. 3-52]
MSATPPAIPDEAQRRTGIGCESGAWTSSVIARRRESRTADSPDGSTVAAGTPAFTGTTVPGWFSRSRSAGAVRLWHSQLSHPPSSSPGLTW